MRPAAAVEVARKLLRVKSCNMVVGSVSLTAGALPTELIPREGRGGIASMVGVILNAPEVNIVRALACIGNLKWSSQAESLIEVPECFWRPIIQTNSRLRIWGITKFLTEAITGNGGRAWLSHSAGSLALELDSCRSF